MQAARPPVRGSASSVLIAKGLMEVVAAAVRRGSDGVDTVSVTNAISTYRTSEAVFEAALEVGGTHLYSEVKKLQAACARATDGRTVLSFNREAGWSVYCRTAAVFLAAEVVEAARDAMKGVPKATGAAAFDFFVAVLKAKTEPGRDDLPPDESIIKLYGLGDDVPACVRRIPGWEDRTGLAAVSSAPPAGPPVLPGPAEPYQPLPTPMHAWPSAQGVTPYPWQPPAQPHYPVQAYPWPPALPGMAPFAAAQLPAFQGGTPPYAQRDQPRACFKCGSPDHLQRHCPLIAAGARPAQVGTAPAPSALASPCARCGRMGHASKDCTGQPKARPNRT